MRIARTVVLLSLVALSVSSTAWAQNRKGVQAILLHCWNPDTSLKLFLNTMIQASPQGQTPRPVFEIAVQPYPERRNDETGRWEPNCLPWGIAKATQVTPDIRFQNLHAAILTLVQHMDLRITVHLGRIHAASVDRSRLQAQMQEVWDWLIVPFYGDPRVAFHISPGLEDEYSTEEFVTAAKATAAGLYHPAVEFLVSQNRFFFRSNGSNAGRPSQIWALAIGVPVLIPVQRESHGSSAPSHSTGAWSNDGGLAYCDSRENHDDHDGLRDAAGDRLSCAKFGGSSWPGFKLLWRPAYNVWEKKTTSTKITHYKGKTTGRRDTASGKFDELEVKCLRRFLGQ